jgi:hypothetical protein
VDIASMSVPVKFAVANKEKGEILTGLKLG